MPVFFLITFLPYFGEEYGWRYYLQPILQNHFRSSQSNKEVTWENLLSVLIIYGILFTGFFFTKYFKGNKYLILTLNKKADQAKAPDAKATPPSNESKIE